MKGPLLLLSGVEADAEGHIAPQYRGRILNTLRTYPGIALDIEIRRHRSKRSLKQNNRHWALMTIAAEQLWGDKSEKDTLHEELAHMYFALPPCPKTGMRRRRRTPDTDTKEFADFHEWCVDQLTQMPDVDLTEWENEARRLEESAA